LTTMPWEFFTNIQQATFVNRNWQLPGARPLNKCI